MYNFRATYLNNEEYFFAGAIKLYPNARSIALIKYVGP